MAVADATQRELSYRKRLIEIANMINSASSIQDILVDIKDKILDLVEAERVTIFALDTKNQELFSLFKAGQEVKEIRVPKTFGSIAGFTALSRKTVNITNAYDPAELARLHPNLKFDSRWDKASGFRTTQVLATPIVFEKYLLGVLQLINKRGGTRFTSKDEKAAEELAKILGIAFYNQHRAARSNRPSKYGHLVDKGLVSEKDIEKAVTSARSQPDRRGDGPDRGEQGPQGGDRHGALSPSTTAFWAPGDELMPEELKAAAHPRVPEEEHVRADREEGGDAPGRRRRPLRPHAPRRHQGHEPGPAPRVPASPFARTSSPTSRRATARRAGSVEDEADLGRDHHGAGDAARRTSSRRPRRSRSPRSTRPTAAIVKLANQIIIDAYNKGASDIHIEPYGKHAPTLVRLRVDGDCQKYLEVPAPHRNALVQRFKIMSKLDISEKRKPQDGKIRFRGPMGTIELRVATIPTSGGNEDIVMRILAASKPLPLEKMGFSDRNLNEFKAILDKPYGICLVVGPTGSGKTTTLHSGLGYHQQRGDQDLDRRGPRRDHPARPAPGPDPPQDRLHLRRRPCAPSCAPTPT